MAAAFLPVATQVLLGSSLRPWPRFRGPRKRLRQALATYPQTFQDVGQLLAPLPSVDLFLQDQVQTESEC